MHTFISSSFNPKLLEGNSRSNQASGQVLGWSLPWFPRMTEVDRRSTVPVASPQWLLRTRDLRHFQSYLAGRCQKGQWWITALPHGLRLTSSHRAQIWPLIFQCIHKTVVSIYTWTNFFAWSRLLFLLLFSPCSAKWVIPQGLLSLSELLVFRGWNNPRIIQTVDAKIHNAWVLDRYLFS